jgi:hypothetical protein
MNPMTEKMTKPANIEVDELTLHTISASLETKTIRNCHKTSPRISLVDVVIELVVASKSD